MNKHKAEILRNCIIKQYKESGLIDNFTKTLDKFGIKSVEDWALSVDDIIELNLENPELYFMEQMAKIARLMGLSEQDSKSVALKAFADHAGDFEVT